MKKVNNSCKFDQKKLISIKRQLLSTYFLWRCKRNMLYSLKTFQGPWEDRICESKLVKNIKNHMLIVKCLVLVSYIDILII